jgi:hypothetical protein
VPSDELFAWWSDRVAATGLALYGRRLWETMSSHWPSAGQQPGVTPAQVEFSRPLARHAVDEETAVDASSRAATTGSSRLGGSGTDDAESGAGDERPRPLGVARRRSESGSHPATPPGGALTS